MASLHYLSLIRIESVPVQTKLTNTFMPLQVLEPSEKSFALTTLEALLLLRLCQSIGLDRFRIHNQLPDVEIRESEGDGGCGEECGGDLRNAHTRRHTRLTCSGVVSHIEILCLVAIPDGNIEL
jgi:hypothetical protein